jgi:Rieske Fe-S protein
MERKQFLKSLGAGAAFALTVPCAYSCSKEGIRVDEPTGIDFTIDLTSPEASALTENGGFILKDLVVIAKNLEGNYVAATQVCSHRGYDQVRFNTAEGGIFYCDVHGSKFDQNGEPLNKVGLGKAKPITVYQTVLNGDLLRVFE